MKRRVVAKSRLRLKPIAAAKSENICGHCSNVAAARVCCLILQTTRLPLQFLPRMLEKIAAAVDC